MLADVEMRPGNDSSVCGVQTALQRVTGPGYPGKTRQVAEPGGQRLEAIATEPQEFKRCRIIHARGEIAEAVSRQHQFLQLRPFPQFDGQDLDLVVGQGQPAQHWRQGFSGNLAQPGATKTDLAQRGAIAQRCGKPLEMIAGAKQRAQPVKAPHVVGERGQRAAAKIENFKRVGESENLAREFAQPMKPQFARPGEIAATERKFE